MSNNESLLVDSSSPIIAGKVQYHNYPFCGDSYTLLNPCDIALYFSSQATCCQPFISNSECLLTSLSVLCVTKCPFYVCSDDSLFPHLISRYG